MGTVVFICQTFGLAAKFVAVVLGASALAALCVYVFGKTVGAF